MEIARSGTLAIMDRTSMLMERNDASRDGIGRDAWNGGECVASPGERCARVSPNKDKMDMDQDDASSVDTSSSDEG